MQLDQFESRFRKASKELFNYQEVHYRKVLLVTDLEEAKARELLAIVRPTVTGADPDAEWNFATKDAFQTVSQLLKIIDQAQPDLIVVYRHIGYLDAPEQYTLGIFVDVLTQATIIPILMIPEPSAEGFADKLSGMDRVIVVTDHLQGDFRLIDRALPFANKTGRLQLLHVEDQSVFDRYMEAVEKIEDIHTTAARDGLLEVLLGEPKDFIESVQESIAEALPELEVEAIVRLGQPLSYCGLLIKEHAAGLIVANTKDDGQLAMRGMAYALAVEFQDTPMLLL